MVGWATAEAGLCLVTNFLASSPHNTRLASPMLISQPLRSRGLVSKALFMNGTWTTATCRATDRAIAPQSRRLVKRCRSALDRVRAGVEGVEQLGENERRERHRSGVVDIARTAEHPAVQTEVEGGKC